MMDAPLRAFLADLFRTAVAAAHPASCLPPLLPPPPVGQLILLAAGKAAGSMAEVAEGFYLDRLKLPAGHLYGNAVARHGYGRPLKIVTMIEAAHPVPDGRLRSWSRSSAAVRSRGAPPRCRRGVRPAASSGRDKSLPRLRPWSRPPCRRQAE